MKTIDIKVSTDQVHIIYQLLEPIYFVNASTLKKKIEQSIIMDVSSIFKNKHHSLSKKRDIFSSKKTHNVSLKFHESFALHSVLQNLAESITDVYQKTITEKLVANLHQKMQ